MRHSRRSTDNIDVNATSSNYQSLDGCNQLTECPEIAEIRADLQEIKDSLASVAQILEAWNNAQGFFKTLTVIGSIFKWLAGVLTAIALIWAYIKHGR